MGVSLPGMYEGYSELLFDGHIRQSFYIQARDGTNLAFDLFLPTKGGEKAAEPLPTLWTYHRYGRAHGVPGKYITQLYTSPWLNRLIQHGYAIGVADARGCGASFGRQRVLFSSEEAQDTYDITEWLAVQEWCNGRIGMFGSSYSGTMQYLAAASAPPHLIAIFPQMAVFDLYDFISGGGILKQDFLNKWSALVREYDSSVFTAAVDEDQDGSMLAAALSEHRYNSYPDEIAKELPYRDSKNPLNGEAPFDLYNPASYLNRVAKSGVAVYMLTGWLDMWTRDAILWFQNLTNPRKLTIGQWAHAEVKGFDLAAEHLRWFDYWLKSIDNGVMDEPAIYYFSRGDASDTHWKSTRSWPPTQCRIQRFYMREGPSSSVSSKNDGLLLPSPPDDEHAKEHYIVDPFTTSGKGSRWANGYEVPIYYGNLFDNDAKGITFTTPPFQRSLNVTGHVIVNLWIQSAAEDCDFFVYLEEVWPGGFSHYITEGSLRASLRDLSLSPHDRFNLPYHRCCGTDVRPVERAPARLVFDLHPISNEFEVGHRMRVTITCADRDNAELSPSSCSEICLHRSQSYPSYVEVPVIPGTSI
jgi:uncharacterized protein